MAGLSSGQSAFARMGDNMLNGGVRQIKTQFLDKLWRNREGGE